MASDVVTPSGNGLRDNLITTAVKFLTNPNIQKCTMESKEKFLRSKGLSDPEIQKAIEKCAEMVDLPSLSSELMFFRHTRTSWFREHVLPFVVYGGCLYGLYWFYKNCLRHLLFVEEPKRKTTAECIEELRKTMDMLNSNISALRTDVHAANHQSNHGGSVRTQLENLKADIASVKGILLNRNQFPSIKTRAETSIPSWQRQAQEATSTAPDASPTHRPRSQRSESGGSNASNSSGEHAAKNSDSSLEIIT